MATIEGLGPMSQMRAGTRVSMAGRGGFALPPEAGRGPAQAPSLGMPAPVALDAMLALQEAEVETEQDRIALRYGQAVLATLEALQRILLAGGDVAGALDRLHGLADGTPRAADPPLAAILDSIRLRARVELARRGI